MMQVTLAGFSVDAEVLRKVGDDEGYKEMLTPETICAAYARISRDPRPVGELRAEAVEDVASARKSNKKIIFEYGHASVAENAFFNFDVVGITRLAIEFLERFRLCSFLEKSQRYITLDNDFRHPEEIIAIPLLHQRLAVLLEEAFELYQKFNPILKGYFQATRPKAGKRLHEGWSKEDARYLSLLCTTGQLGLSCNARNLEHIIRRAMAAPLEEVRELGRALYAEANKIAPSLLRHSEVTRYDRERAVELELLARELETAASDCPPPTEEDSAVCIHSYTLVPDTEIAMGLLHSVLPGKSLVECWDYCSKTKSNTREVMSRVLQVALRHMEFYDAAPREFEHVNFTFELNVSASCYAQLKRHRMCTQTVQPYDVEAYPTIPQSISEIGLEADYLVHLSNAAALYQDVAEACGREVAEYVLTNGHRRRILVTMNMRELYHFSRMRVDAHAQWEIRSIACEMVDAVIKVAPLSGALLCGKDGFVERVAKVYNKEWAAQKQEQ